MNFFTGNVVNNQTFWLVIIFNPLQFLKHFNNLEANQNNTCCIVMHNGCGMPTEGRLLLRTPGPVPLWDLQVF